METYMSVDEFLEKYFAAFKQDPQGWGNNFFWSMASETPQKFFEWYEKHKHQIKTPELQELYAEIAKAQAAGTSDAKNFLYTVKVLTAFDNAFTGKEVPQQKLDEYTEVVLNAINAKKRKVINPQNSYELLRRIDREYDHQYAVVSRELALNPLSTPHDVYEWLDRYVDSRHNRMGEYNDESEFIGSIDDAKKKLKDLAVITKTKLEQEINPEGGALSLPNMDTIKSFEASTIPRIARQIVVIVEFMAKTGQDGQTKEDVEKAKSVAAEMTREFDMNKILDIKHGNYVQQYADQAEFQLAEMRPAFEKMQQELETLRPERIKMTNMWDEERQKVQKLEGDKEKLLRENNNLMSTIDFLKGKIKLFLTAFKKRAEERELPIKKAKGLQEVVANDLEGALNIEQIERDLSAARQRQTEIMRNSPVRI